MSTKGDKVQQELVGIYAKDQLLCLCLERMILEAMLVVTQNASATVRQEQLLKKRVQQQEMITIDFTDM